MPPCADTLAQVRSAALIDRYDAAVPRYTSYPTAAQFTSAVGPGDWSDWLAQTSPDDAVSLYVHLPFCRRLCWYCGCNTRAVNRAETISSYVDLLAREATMVAAATGRRPRVGSLHLGGGTPNMLSPADLDQLFAGLDSAFDLTGISEIAAELDPAVLTREWVDAAAAHGLNRASLGVQDLSPRVQAAVNRIESFAVIEQAAQWLRDAGVRSLNLDLMYGLPRQGLDEVLATLDQVITLKPDRIALFGYAHVPWMKPHQKLIDASEMAGPHGRFAQSQAAARFLTANGYQAVGLDHFALPEDSLARAAAGGSLRRDFQGYTTDQASTLIGLGASSIGRSVNGYVQNHTLERDWRAAVTAGALPVARGVAMTRDDHFRAEIIERLMCDFTVDLEQVAERHGRAWRTLHHELAALDALAPDGLVERIGARITVPLTGRPFVRVVCAPFDATNRPEEGRHSRAI